MPSKVVSFESFMDDDLPVAIVATSLLPTAPQRFLHSIISIYLIPFEHQYYTVTLSIFSVAFTANDDPTTKNTTRQHIM
jgi:hypothetical protein